MSTRRFMLAPLAALWLAAAAPALAGGSDIGEAGLKALDKGAYAQAVKLFTQALAASDLSDDDREFAFLCRAKAYLGEGDRQHALSDLNQAVQLKPDDAEAQALLEHAFGRSAAPAAEQAAAPDGWGLLGTLAGNAYWREAPGADPHTAYVQFNWITPGQSLSEIIHDRRHVSAAIELVLDPQAHRILIAAQYDDGPHYGTATTARGGAAVERVFAGGKPITETMRLESGAVQDIQTTFENGGWTQTAAYTLVRTNYDELVAAGFLKKKK